MPRARKGAARTQARRRLLRLARGFRGTRRKHKSQAKVALLRAGQFAYRDRRTRRRDFRRLWITRLAAACRMRGTRYSRFIHGLQRSGVLLNRKMLSELAIQDPAVFDRLVEMARSEATGDGARQSPRQRSKPNPTPSVIKGSARSRVQ